MRVFLKRKDGTDAMGEYDLEKKTLVVLKGSKVSGTISQSEKFRGANTIEKYRAQYVKGMVVKEDVFFKSASTAANFVTGSSTNGLIAWKTTEGKNIKQLMQEKA